MAQQDPWAAFPDAAPAQPQTAPQPAAPAGGQVIAPLQNPRRDRMDNATIQAQQAAQQATQSRLGMEAERLRLAQEEAARKAQVEGSKATEAQQREQEVLANRRERFARTQTIQGVIGDLRRLAQESLSVGRLAGGITSVPGVGAVVGQNRANLEQQLDTLRGDILQQILGEMAETNQGGVSRLADTRAEQDAIIASIANISPDQDLPQFLKGLDRAEQFFRRRQDTLRGQLGVEDDEGAAEDLGPPNFTVGDFTPRTGDMDRVQFEAQLSELLRRGASADLVTEWSKQTPHTITDQRQLNEAIEAYRGGYRGPVRSYESSNATISPQGVASFVRGAGDIMTINFADEGEAVIRSLMDSGLTYEQAWQEAQADRAMDNQGARTLGQFAGAAATAPITVASGFLNAPTLAGQALRGSAFSAGTNTLAGIGAAPMGDRLQTAGQDALIGAAVGAGAPLVVRGATEVGGMVRNFLPGGSQRQATQALSELQITPDVLRQRAAEFVQATGRSPRMADLLDPSEAGRLQRNLAPSDEAVARVAREAGDEVRGLPANVSGQVQRGGPIEGREAAALRTRQQGDTDFGAIRDVEVPLGPNASLYLEKSIIPEAGLTPLGREQAMEALERGSIPMGLLDTMRKNLRKRGSANPGQGYEDRATELQTFMGEADPRAAEAIDRYARNATRSEAVELGQRAVRPQEGVNFPEQVDAMRYQGASSGRDVSGEITEGLSLGARSAAYRDARAGPSSAYGLLRRMDESPALAQDLRLALGGAEADRLIKFAEVQRRAVDNLSAISGVPVNQAASLLDDAKALTDAAIAGGRGAGGAMVSSMAQRFAQRFGLGRGPANKLAEDLFTPGRFEAVVRSLEKRGKVKDRGQIEEILRDQLIRNFAGRESRGRETATEANRQMLEE
jgi:hypothetical protein